MTFDHPAPEQIPQLLKLWKDAFGEYDGFWELFLDTAYENDHCFCLSENGQPIAALYCFDCSCEEQKIGYLYGVVTLPDYRGRGLCRKLLEEVHSCLLRQGYASAMLVPAEDGLRAMYRKLGYREGTRVSEFTCTAAQTAVPVRTLSKAEYGRLRRDYLPAGGVLQEGKNLDFLAAQAALFGGEDFLLAAYLEGNTLQVMELLGNRDAAPGIVRGMGAEIGRFRTPGQQKPFAMFFPLTEAAVMPTYFGFSFD